MHYYQFNIGDYYSHTAHLSPVEHHAYRTIIDQYYLNERPFNGTPTDVARELGIRSNEDEVTYVLNRYFVQNDNGDWIHERIEEDIQAYHDKRKQQSEAGKASAKARKAKASKRSLNGRSTNVQPTNNHKPITNNHSKSKPKAKRFVPPTLDQVIEYAASRGQGDWLAKKFYDYFTAGNWKDGKGNQVKNWKQKFIAWENHNEKSTGNGPKQTQDLLGRNDLDW